MFIAFAKFSKFSECRKLCYAPQAVIPDTDPESVSMWEKNELKTDSE